MLVLSDTNLAEIDRLGRLRSPEEACGLLIGGKGIIELPNRSSDPQASYRLNQHDIEAVVSDDDTVAVWHTHPRGLIGPSRGDMKHRLPAGVQMLVVTLTDTGPVPTWF